MQVARFTNHFYDEINPPFRGGTPPERVCYWVEERNLLFWFGKCDQLVIKYGHCRDANGFKSKDLDPITLDTSLIDEIEKTLDMRNQWQHQMYTTAFKLIAATPPG